MYQINCAEIKNQPETLIVPPIPVVSLFYGPNVANFQVLARPISHTGPVVECNDKGEAKVTMLITHSDPKISFATDLLDKSGNALSNQVLQSYESTPHGVDITFIVRVPENGNYALALYSNEQDTSSNTFVPFCYYLVHSKAQNENLGKFPSIPNDIVGVILPNFHDLSLIFKHTYPTADSDVKRGFLKTDEEGEIILVFNHEQPLTILSDFHSSTQSVSFNQYTSVQTIGLTTAVQVRTPSKECGNASPFVLKVYAAEISNTQQIPSMYVAIVYPFSADIKVDPFPQSPTKSWGPTTTTTTKFIFCCTFSKKYTSK